MNQLDIIRSRRVTFTDLKNFPSADRRNEMFVIGRKLSLSCQQESRSDDLLVLTVGGGRLLHMFSLHLFSQWVERDVCVSSSLVDVTRNRKAKQENRSRSRELSETSKSFLIYSKRDCRGSSAFCLPSIMIMTNLSDLIINYVTA